MVLHFFNAFDSFFYVEIVANTTIIYNLKSFMSIWSIITRDRIVVCSDFITI